jgi:hypothetical protein
LTISFHCILFRLLLFLFSVFFLTFLLLFSVDTWKSNCRHDQEHFTTDGLLPELCERLSLKSQRRHINGLAISHVAHTQHLSPAVADLNGPSTPYTLTHRTKSCGSGWSAGPSCLSRIIQKHTEAGQIAMLSLTLFLTWGEYITV